MQLAPATAIYAMTTTSIRVATTARLPVTIVGDTRAGLLAIAGYGTPHELVIAAIAVKLDDERRDYRVAGGLQWTHSLQAVAQPRHSGGHADASVSLTARAHRRHHAVRRSAEGWPPTAADVR